MSVKLDDIVSLIVQTAPAGELNDVARDLAAIVPGSSTSAINKAVESYIDEHGIVFSGQYLASKYNKDPNSTKFWDYAKKQKFNYDLKTNRAIDFESAEPQVSYPSLYNQLLTDIGRYGDDHYPSEFAFTVVPVSADEVTVVLVGQKINKENFYTGRWKSVYKFANGQGSGTVQVDIHYYEDGNVRLNFEQAVGEAAVPFTASGIVNFINQAEHKLTLQIIDEFNTLNQNAFKNLRRLLPVTKSKINWGKAIGNYRLGTDVVNQS